MNNANVSKTWPRGQKTALHHDHSSDVPRSSGPIAARAREAPGLDTDEGLDDALETIYQQKP